MSFFFKFIEKNIEKNYEYRSLKKTIKKTGYIFDSVKAVVTEIISMILQRKMIHCAGM